MMTIGIVTYKIHLDNTIKSITEKCINSIINEKYPTIVLDSFSEPPPIENNFTTIRCDGNLYKSWNIICRKAFYDNNHDYVMILNNDIILKSNLENILQDTIDSKSSFTSAYEQNGKACQPYSAFILKRHLYENIGPFEEKYTFLYGDIDYQKKIEEKKLKQHISKKFIVDHFEHSTAMSDKMKNEINKIKLKDTETMKKLLGGWYEPLMLIDEKGKVITKSNYNKYT